MKTTAAKRCNNNALLALSLLQNIEAHCVGLLLFGSVCPYLLLLFAVLANDDDSYLKLPFFFGGQGAVVCLFVLLELCAC